MNHHYSDITDKLGEPLWWDENAVPRYCEFSPQDTANIYRDECALVLIRCQNCGREFKVAFSDSRSARYLRRAIAEKTAPGIADRIRDNTLHYGDPPNIHCCPSGPTMNSVPIRVLEYWRLNRAAWEMVRDTALEKPLEVAWALS